MYCCERLGRKFQALRETRVRRIHGMFLLSSRLQHRVLVRFFQVLLTWLSLLKLNTFFCSLQWVKKVTAQMIPSPRYMARCSWQVQCACTIARLSPCTRRLWPFSFSLKSIDAKMAGQQHSVYFFSSLGLLEHDFMKKTAREKIWSARVSRLECTRSPRPVERGRPQCPVSYPDNNSASHLFYDKFCGRLRILLVLVLFFKVENNSLELTRIFKESFKDQRWAWEKSVRAEKRDRDAERERKRRFGVNS